MFKKSYTAKYLCLLGCLVGAVGLPVQTLFVYQLLLVCFPGQEMRDMILEPVDGSLKIFRIVVLIFQVPAGVILGFCTGLAITLLKNGLLVPARQVSLGGAAFVGIPLTYFFWGNYTNGRHPLACMLLFGLPLSCVAAVVFCILWIKKFDKLYVSPTND